MRNRDDDRVHFSELCQMAKSPAHYAWACTKPKDETRAMRVGAAVDARVFGHSGSVVVFDGIRRGKQWEAFQAENSSKVILNEGEFADAVPCAEALLSDRVSGPILRRGISQVVLSWEQDGVPCAAGIPGKRGGVDTYDPKDAVIWDVKCTNSAEPERASAHAIGRWWHAQLAWYCHGWRVSRHEPVSGAGLILVESSAPYCVTVLRCPDHLLMQGTKSIAIWLDRYKGCEAENVWPGYLQSIGDMVERWTADEEDEP